MKFDLISDFHVEFNVGYNTTPTWERGDPLHYAWHKDRKSDVLVIAGDTSNFHEHTRDIIVEAARFYEHVVFVDGNHDHYSNRQNGWSVMRDMEWFNRQFTWNDRIVDNVTFLDGSNNLLVGTTLFIGANGWYNFRHSTGADPRAQERTWKRQSNDPVYIRFGKKNRPEKLARRQTDQLVEKVKLMQDYDAVEEIVVVTHTLPTERAFGQFANPSHPFFPLNGAYCNNWMNQVWQADEAQKITTWCFGHTHERRDFFQDHVHFVCNPRGYRGEKRWHDPFNGIQQVDTQDVMQSAFGEIED